MLQESLASRLERLAASIVAGDVVFFIGAGFSLNSEGNSAEVLIARLLARFEAITTAVLQSKTENAQLAELCRNLRRVLMLTFDVKADRTGLICGKYFWRNLQRTQREYYIINDWMCSAFDALLGHSDRLQELSGEIHRREVEWLSAYFARRKMPGRPTVQEPDFARYGELARSDDPSSGLSGRVVAGKALFLDTMGFADPAVMAGEPLRPDADEAIASYGDRLRDRHIVLAWLALEGLLPVTLTTNYDLLIEGAFRVAGMSPSAAGETSRAPELELSRRQRWFTAISDATQFFSHGDGYASALIVKIHGCVRAYREQRDSRMAANWSRVLRTMVFTFREIQNWREDSWSRDYIQTLLRSRTVAFAGYSTADPVMHDTFRSVYEEMARYRIPPRTAANASPAEQRDGAPRVPAAPSQPANAYFFRLASRAEFHGIEILRAASRAAGVANPQLHQHENVLDFSGDTRGFPTIDDTMAWTFHLAYRQLQVQALDAELRRVSYQLFGHLAPPREMDEIRDAFRLVVEQERQAAGALEVVTRADARGSWSRADAARRRFRRLVGWTLQFHRQLMREYSAADLILRKPERAPRVCRAMRRPWYAPLNDHPAWAAWAVIVELALRREAAARIDGSRWQSVDVPIEPVLADRVAVVVPNGKDKRRQPRVCLTIALPDLRLGAGTPPALKVKPLTQWTLRSHTVPWWVSGDSHRPPATPDALTLWRSARGVSPHAGDPSRDLFAGENHAQAHRGDRQVGQYAGQDAERPRPAPLDVDRGVAGV